MLIYVLLITLKLNLMEKLRILRKSRTDSLKRNLLQMLILLVFMVFSTLSASAEDSILSFQQIPINGTIVDASNNEPLPGVNVIVKGTTIGASTDIDGKFSLLVPSLSSTLQVSFIGYITREVNISGQTNINISLAPDVAQLSEVVVVGYGTQKKVSLTSAVAPIDGEDLTKRTVNNIQQSLQGNLPGLTVIDQGAGPGKADMVMRIRGITTLSNNDPLIIVDGIEQSLTNINPNDIESITVLKDASSTAIYGSRASNGVLLISTKRAKSKELAISYNFYYALQKSNNNPVHMGLEDYMRLQNVAWTNSSGNPIYTEDYIQEYLTGNKVDKLKYPDVNTWYDAVLSTAPQINHSLSISGGTDKLKALFSGRYQNQDGIIANSKAKIYEFRLNTDYQLSSKISISSDINYRYRDLIAPINEGNVFYYMLQNCQFTVPKYPDGTYGISSDGHNALLYAEAAGTAKTFEDYLVGNLKGTWNIAEGLTFTAQFGNRINLTRGKNFRNSYYVYDYFQPTLLRKSQAINSLTESYNNEREYTVNSLLNYTKTFKEDHFINLLAGYSQIRNNYGALSAYREQFYNNEIQSLSQGANDGTKTNSGAESNWGLRSYFGRINYGFKDKYLFEANARYDGSSRFVKKNRYSFFPSFSFGWRISEEQFFAPVKSIISELKLRGSYGKAGNQAVNLYSYLATLSNYSYTFGGKSVPGYRQAALANQDLTWETTTQSDIGLDAQFFNNRLSLTVDYYYKKTTDILLTLPVPSTLGLNASPQNAGRVDNRGWEFLLETKNTFGDFGFNGNINFNINNNKVVDLAGTGPYFYGGNETRYSTREGYPIRAYWGYLTDGYFQSQEEIANYPNMRSGLAPGDVKFVDRNEDGKITADDMTYLGNSFPKYTFGSNLNFTYKNFSLNLMFQGVTGYNARIGGAIVEMGIWGGFTHKLITDNYWTPDNRNARFPRPLKYDLRNIVFADRDLQDGTYLRLKNIQLSYNVPSSITQKVKIQQATVYVATTNLLTFASLNEWNVDPETVPGGRTQVYPQTSLTTFGVNINF